MLAHQENHQMYTISKKAAENANARSVWLISILTSVFLPVSFIASVYGMGMFGLADTSSESNNESDKNEGKLFFSSQDLGQAVSVMVGMVVVTFAIWGLLEWRTRRSDENNEEGGVY